MKMNKNYLTKGYFMTIVGCLIIAMFANLYQANENNKAEKLKENRPKEEQVKSE